MARHDGSFSDSLPEVSAKSLGFMSSLAVSAIPYLIELFSSPESDQADAAVRAIVSIDPSGQTSVPLLIRVTSNSNTNARRYAALALGALGASARDAIPSLTALLK